MEGFDEAGIFFSDNLSREDQSNTGPSDGAISIKIKFKDFLKNFHHGTFNYKYSQMIQDNYNCKKFYIEVEFNDLLRYNEKLAESFSNEPNFHLPLFEEATKELADEIMQHKPEDHIEVHSFQVMFHSSSVPISLRDLKSSMVSRVVKIPGIIVSASGIKSKATSITLQCKSCGNVVPKMDISPGLEGLGLPRRCTSEMNGQTKCPLDPYMIRVDNCQCVDFQVLKLQELPDSVPQGEMPRHLQLYCDRYLCEQVVPGNKVLIVGIYCIRKNRSGKRRGDGKDKNVGVRNPYVRILGIKVDQWTEETSASNQNSEEHDPMLFMCERLSKSPNVYETICKSIAPSIFGFENEKKAIACLLFGGSRKRMPDGLTRRGDINILLLGDPGTAKSQLLKFVERVSPIAVYTSGKGSSAAGLTASVSRDPHTRNFVMEGGAMVLADGGVVCIDEFDKMREDDRVAIHEAMEQQTISIAKAGITTTLNSRCSVLAAANSVYGRWDDLKGAENIDFMPTILSRFDMIFIIKDEHNKARDITLAKHIMNVHTKANELNPQKQDGELELNELKYYINYCRKRCGPRLTEAAAEKLKTKYVLMRSGSHKHEMESSKSLSIPITVRQLEAVIRISESLAKMEMKPFATERHVDESLRLFQVSTMEAALSGTLAGSDEFTSTEDYEMLMRIEKQLKKRFAVGVQVSEKTIVQDFIKQKYPEHSVRRVISIMMARGELAHRQQRKLLIRLR
uniref:DNA replication licensing factor MCM5 n=2 Tax=Lygus hesperus TaxID=30085 RepID=A0A0A9W762_LYGHE